MLKRKQTTAKPCKARARVRNPGLSESLTGQGTLLQVADLPLTSKPKDQNSCYSLVTILSGPEPHNIFPQSRSHRKFFLTCHYSIGGWLVSIMTGRHRIMKSRRCISHSCHREIRVQTFRSLDQRQNRRDW